MNLLKLQKLQNVDILFIRFTGIPCLFTDF